MLPRQPDDPPAPGATVRQERAASAEERKLWVAATRSVNRSIIYGGIGGAVVCGATAAGLFLGLWRPLAGAWPPSWVAWAIAGLPAPWWLSKSVRAIAWRVRNRPPDQMRVVDIVMRDARAYHVDNGDKLEGWLFVISATESVFIVGQCLWLPPDDADVEDEAFDSDWAPSGLRLVIGVSPDGSCVEIACEDRGQLRRIPPASDDVVQAVQGVMKRWAFGEYCGLLPTPPTLRDAATPR